MSLRRAVPANSLVGGILEEHVKQLHGSDLITDCKIITADDSWPVDKFVLALRSDLLVEALKDDVLDLSTFDSDYVDIFVQYLYGDDDIDGICMSGVQLCQKDIALYLLALRFDLPQLAARAKSSFGEWMGRLEVDDLGYIEDVPRFCQMVVQLYEKSDVTESFDSFRRALVRRFVATNVLRYPEGPDFYESVMATVPAFTFDVACYYAELREDRECKSLDCL